MSQKEQLRMHKVLYTFVSFSLFGPKTGLANPGIKKLIGLAFAPASACRQRLGEEDRHEMVFDFDLGVDV